MIGTQYVVAGVAAAFIGLGVYTYVLHTNYAECKLGRVEDNLKAEQKVRELAEQDAIKTAVLRSQHDAEVERLQSEAQQRENEINRAATTACKTPDLDAFLDSVRRRTNAPGSGGAPSPTRK